MRIMTEGGCSLSLERRGGEMVATITAPKILIEEGSGLPYTTAAEATLGRVTAIAATAATTALTPPSE